MRLLCLIAFTLVACSAPDASTDALRAAGYTDIRMTGWAPLSCGGDDTYSTGFSARNPAGEMASGVVCCGMLFKGCTIRHK